VKYRGAVLTAETFAITDCVCVLADASTEKPQCLTDKGVHTMEAFSDFIWARLDGPPPTEAEMKSVATWLIEADPSEGLAKIIWHNSDQDTMDMVMYMGCRQYADIPTTIIDACPFAMSEYILLHLAHPGDLNHKFLDVTEEEFLGTGLDAYSVPSPVEGDANTEEVELTEDDLMGLMKASISPSDWRTKTVYSFALNATAQRLMPVFKFIQHYWGLQRMETWLAALDFTTAWKEKLLRMILDPTQQEAVTKATIGFNSSILTCADRWNLLGLSAEHINNCGSEGCTQPCVIKICSGGNKTTQIGAPNDAAITNKGRPMIVCKDWNHNAFEKPPKNEGGRPQKAMTYIYLDVWFCEKILQWHYQQGWSTEEIVQELKKKKYKMELSLIYRWRALQGIVNPNMWDFPQAFDRDIKEMVSSVQLEMTENVKKQKNAMIKSMKEAATQFHNSSDKPVFQALGGERRLSLQTSVAAQTFKRQRLNPPTPGLASHVESGKGYPSDRTTITPVPYQGRWNEKFPEHANLTQTQEGKGGKGKSGKKDPKGKGKGKGKSPKGKNSGKGKKAWHQSADGNWQYY